MKKQILIAMCALAAAISAAAQPAPGAADYGRLPAISSVRISPDGRRVIFAAADGDDVGYFVRDIDTGANVAGARIPAGMSLRGVSFADDNIATFTVSRRFAKNEVLPSNIMMTGPNSTIEYWRTGIALLDSNRFLYLMQNHNEGWGLGYGEVVTPIEGETGTARMIMPNAALNSSLAVYRVNLRSGQGMAIRQGIPNTFDFVLDGHGEPVARLDSNDVSNHWKMWVYDHDRERLLAEGDSETGLPERATAAMANGDFAVLDRPADQDRYILYELNPANNARTVLWEQPRYDIASVIVDPWTHLAVGAQWVEDYDRQHFFEADLEAASQRLAPLFADGFGEIISWSRDRKRFIVYGEHADDAGGFYVFEPESGQLRVVGMSYPTISGPAALGERQAIQFRARDGASIPAYLTLPAGAEGRRLPLVLLVHGGPASRDSFGFDYWASFFASRGYAVLQPNFRGSNGYGRTWENAGRGQWGDGRMQTDVEDGVNALVRAGIADAQHVCIVGASYGGYAALAGATITPDRYACAVSVAGVSNLPRFLLEKSDVSGGRRSATSDYWRLSIGDRDADRTHLDAISPALLANRVQAPVLLIHGSDDSTVPIDQSQLMNDALRHAGKSVRLVTLEGDDHYLSVAATRIQTLSEIETFLAAHLGQAAPAH